MEIKALDVVDAIRSTMGELSQMGPDDSFADLDIDSLSLVEAAVVLSNKFGTRIDESLHMYVYNRDLQAGWFFRNGVKASAVD